MSLDPKLSPIFAQISSFSQPESPKTPFCETPNKKSFVEVVSPDSNFVQTLSSPPLSPDSPAFIARESQKESHTIPVTETPEKWSFVDKVSLDSFPTQTIEPNHSSSPRVPRRPRRKAKTRRSVGTRGSSVSSDSTNSGGLDNFPASKY